MRGRLAVVLGLVVVLVGVVVAGVVGLGGDRPDVEDGGGEGVAEGAGVDAGGGVAESVSADGVGRRADDDVPAPAAVEGAVSGSDRGTALGAESAGRSGSPSVSVERGPGEVPVLLVPGWLDTARDLAAMRIRLLGAGWPGELVATLTFDEPTGSNRIHAVELAEAVDTLLARSGAEEVDIVAHSMGGLATRWYLRTHPDAPVRRVAFLGSPHRGTLAAHLAWGEGRQEMMPDSPFLDTLNAEAPAPLGVEAVTVRTAVDTHIVPGESATLPGVVDHELCCPTHPGLIRDDDVFEIVLEFLERGPGETGDEGSGVIR